MNFSEQADSLTIQEEARLTLMLEQPYFQKCDTSKSTLLHYSARCGNNELTQFLLRKGYDVNAQDYKKRTPLMMGIKGQYVEVVETLLAAGADIWITDYKGRSTLQMSCAKHNLYTSNKLILKKCCESSSNSRDAAKKLIDAGCPLYRAAFLQDAKIIEYMLEQGHSVNSMHPTKKITALHVAVMGGNLESVKLLLKYGADAEAVESEGLNSLCCVRGFEIACTTEKIEILKILLSLGVSATTCIADGTFQIRPTLEYGICDAVNLVLQSNIDFTATNSSGDNLLHCLATNTNPGIVEKLKSHIDKLDYNKINNSGMIPLHHAAIYGNIEMVKFLLDQGSEINIRNNIYGYTPLYYACSESELNFENNYDQCVELLLQHNADPQFVYVTKNGEHFTLLDITLNSNKIKSIIGHLALLEVLGTPIIEIIRSKIYSDLTLRKYFNRYRKVLKWYITGSVTLLKLITSNERRIAKYLHNEHLVLKLKRLCNKQEIKFSFSYYYKTLEKNILNGMKFKRLKDKAFRVMNQISEQRFDNRSLVTDKIIDYLNNQNLKQLCKEF